GQAGRGARKRRDVGDARPRTREDGRARHDAPALAQLHRLAPRRGSTGEEGQARVALALGGRPDSLEERAPYDVELPAQPAPAEPCEGTDSPGRPAQPSSR